MKKYICLFIFLTLFGAVSVSKAFEKVTFINDHILDVNNGGDSRYVDKSIRIDYSQMYVKGFLGNFRTGWETGGYFKDSRRIIQLS